MLFYFRYIKLKKGFGPDLANQAMENIISSLYELYQCNQRCKNKSPVIRKELPKVPTEMPESFINSKCI